MKKDIDLNEEDQIIINLENSSNFEDFEEMTIIIDELKNEEDIDLDERINNE